MRLAEQDEDKSVRMTTADFGDLVGGVTVAGCNPAQILARHTVEAIDRGAMVTRSAQQFAKRSPVVSPIEIETDTLAQFGFVNLAARPFVEDVLVAGKNGLDSEREWTPMKRGIAQQRGQISL